MYKKKEIIAIVAILGVTVFLAFLPTIISKGTREESVVTTASEQEKTITLRIEGEVNKDDITLEVPYGTSYGYILSKIEVYLNTYSIVSTDLTKRYYEDAIIQIESSDTGHVEVEEGNVDEGKIKISTAGFDELVTLYGIGEKRAQSIIEYRATHEIDSWSTLQHLLGVSDEVIESIQEKAVL